MIQVFTSSSLKTASDVTVTDKEVKKGTAATVTCTLTGLGAGVTISWFSPDDSTNPLSDGDAGECSARNLQKCCLYVNDFTR